MIERILISAKSVARHLRGVLIFQDTYRHTSGKNINESIVIKPFHIVAILIDIHKHILRRNPPSAKFVTKHARKVIIQNTCNDNANTYCVEK